MSDGLNFLEYIEPHTSDKPRRFYKIQYKNRFPFPNNLFMSKTSDI